MVDGPTLRAQFIMTEAGEPKFDRSDDGARVYAIRLFFENVTADVYAVTYELDESYYDRTRDVRVGPEFEARITSYGDYDVRAHVRSRTGTRVVIENLARALRATHGGSESPAVQQALSDIAAN